MKDSIILCGFRATGKSTIGSLLAKTLGWQSIEMDVVLAERAGKPIMEITKHGTDWKEFRTMETALLKELLSEKNIIISAGGGVGVNHHVNTTTGKTYGEEQKEMLTQATNCLTIILMAKPEIISDRIEKDEIAKDTVQRPLLNEATAKELQIKNKSRQGHITAIVTEAMAIEKEREPLYKSLSNYIIDTSNISINEIVDRIVTILNNHENIS